MDVVVEVGLMGQSLQIFVKESTGKRQEMKPIFFVAVLGGMLAASISADQNANLSVAMTGTVSITFICHYIGAGNETLIMWHNRSTLDILTLRPGADVPECVIFTTFSGSYDPRRISTTCDSESNIYTLKIDPIKSIDDNVTWSCAFQDPLPSNQWPNVTIHHTETSGDIDSRGDGGTSSHLSIIGMIVGMIFLIVIAICAGLCIWKKRTFRHNGMFCHKQPYPEENMNEEELNKMNTGHNTD